MKKSRSLSTVAALALFALFAAAMLAVLLGGARVYRGLIARDALSYDRRTAAQYVAARVRQAPAPGAVSVVPFGEGDALVITQDIEGKTYTTTVYCHEGWLRELFARADSDFTPADGEKVLPLADFSATLHRGLLTATLTEDSGDTQTVCLALDEGVAP